MKTATHPFVGYLVAVLIVSLALVLADIVGLFSYTMRPATHPAWGAMSQLMGMTLTIFCVGAFFIFCIALVPVLLVYNVAKRFAIDSAWYYVVMGGFVGVALPLLIFVGPTWYADPPNSPPLWPQIWDSAKFGLPSGALGGFVFWLGTGRFVKRREVSA